MIETLATALGAVMLAYGAYIVAFWVYANFFRHEDLKKYRGTDSWAVVTGGSDGIGLAFAKRLASRSFNVVITGRNEEKLERVVKQLFSILIIILYRYY